ncbi:MAG: glycosyltransferase [Acidobacteriota bacterium]|nr:glycosyltransferase [Acidobacteriota bacterium]
MVSHLDPKYGGLSAVVPALGSAVAAHGRCSISLEAFCRPDEHFAPAVADGIAVSYFPVGRLAWRKDATARRTFQRTVAEASGVHIHGLWQMSTAAAVRAAKSLSKPYVISAHGMLERWALANKPVKKKIYAALCERSNLRGAACLHALTEAEAGDYRRFGLPNPIAVIPNGVDIPASAAAGLFLDRFPALRGRRLILFLGRIHFKKGLDILSEAWARIASRWPEAQLVLAGPDFEGTQALIETRLRELGIERRVTFTGMLDAPLKWSALAAAECFVLPSYSEGLSVSVLEAMGLGLPVIVSEQCNLPEVACHACGLTIQPRVDELSAALEHMLGASGRERSSFGQNGRRLIDERYSWPAIGEQMTALYAWLTGGPRPAGFNLNPGEKR